MANLDYLSGQVLRDATGAAYTGAKASFWSDAGASTPLTTYSDAGLTSANTNPVVADGTTGAFGAIYLQAKRYWRTVTTSGGVSLPQFNSGPIDGIPGFVESATAPSPTYAFLYWYDTTTGKLKRRNSTNSAWLDLGGIDSLINAATVTEQLTGTETAKSSTPDSVAALWQRGTDLASASTLSLPSTGGGVFNVTGTTTITGISSAQGGRSIKLRFAGALTLTHNATSFILPGAANITTIAGDTAEFINEGASDVSSSNWRCFSYQRTGVTQADVPDRAASQSDQETGTTALKAVTPAVQQYHQSACKAWALVDTTGSGTITANYNFGGAAISRTGTGDVTLTFTTPMSSANYVVVGAVLLNSANVSAQMLVRATTTTTVRVQVGSASAGTAADGVFMIACFGDQ